MSPLTILHLKEQAGETPLAASLSAQLQSRASRTTKTGKPYLEVTFADPTGNFALKAWSDSDLYQSAPDLKDGMLLRLDAEWTQNAYGLNAANLRWQPLSAAERASFLAGDETMRARQERDWQDILDACAAISDPRLQALVGRFLDTHGDRFRRAAAARKNHHARRGGLVEHVSQMMRSARAICGVYQELNRDLMTAGVLFHDCGKLWENGYPEEGFAQLTTLHGEMLGHIPLGIELVNKLWREVMDSPDARDWLTLEPASEHVRLHLLHLVASHHGQLEFGSPTLPRTPEAVALHYIDNLDAKLEMMRDAYGQAAEIAPGIYERVFPLPANLVAPLAPFHAHPAEDAAISP